MAVIENIEDTLKRINSFLLWRESDNCYRAEDFYKFGGEYFLNTILNDPHFIVYELEKQIKSLTSDWRELQLDKWLYIYVKHGNKDICIERINVIRYARSEGCKDLALELCKHYRDNFRMFIHWICAKYRSFANLKCFFNKHRYFYLKAEEALIPDVDLSKIIVGVGITLKEIFDVIDNEWLFFAEARQGIRVNLEFDYFEDFKKVYEFNTLKEWI